MKPPYYTATGNFSVPNILNLDLCIPIEDTNNYYIFNSYDLSKLYSNNQQINVVVSQFQKTTDDGTELETNNYDFNLLLELNQLKTFPSNNLVTFDPTKDDALYLLFHNFDAIAIEDLQYFYDNIEDFYRNVQNGNYNMTLPFNHTPKNVLLPRRLGISLILR